MQIRLDRLKFVPEYGPLQARLGCAHFAGRAAMPLGPRARPGSDCEPPLPITLEQPARDQGSKRFICRKRNDQTSANCCSKAHIEEFPQKRKLLVLFAAEWYIAHEAYFYRRRSRMDALIETSVEPRKEWVTPELKKIDIAIITAIGIGPGPDSDLAS
jgi:hypothetical protein